MSPYSHESPRVETGQIMQKELKVTTIPAFDETIPTLISGDCDNEDMDDCAITETSQIDWDDKTRIEEYIKRQRDFEQKLKFNPH